MKRFAAILIASLLASGCSVLPESQERRSASPAPAAQAPIARSPAAGQCLAELGQAGAQFSAVPDSYTGEGCSTIGTVQMSALRGDSSTLAVSNIGPVQCAVGAAFAAWARFGVDRAAQQYLGARLQRIETYGSYACRNVAGSGRRSAHATAGAIDIAAFVLEDGRRVSVAEGWHGGNSAEREFLRVIQRSACRRFDTVLGPEYDAAHRDHFHLEGVIEGSSFCR
ncbi:extensin family protein [Alteraurantiacibacter aquimixticola]|uniref:Extensin family protein n=1 Tax=Alteraurantiacibacter aquimixticola TaxID=2489173 RepID=A0A4T3F0N2_9SPHN|nr:extensin family protein [Alteraurantiacibacter aquimixticola]TIX50599.1 extensin family protein [Alteraurantiacibacter aquimixticola]